MEVQHGRILYWSANKRLGKILSDANAETIFFFMSDFKDRVAPDGLQQNARVEFIALDYLKRGQPQRKAIHIKIVAPLAVAELAPIVAIRAARPQLPKPSPELTKTLVSPELARKYVRI